MKTKTKFLFVVFCLFLFNGNVFSQTKKQPNIVLFFSDDAGYADFGFTGSKEFETPNIDKLAEQGIVFTNAYVSSSVCGPSRAGLLTGRYQQRFGFIYNNVPGCIDKKAGLSGEKMGLPKDQKTIANYLNEYGYKSSIIGKWHQGHGEGFHPLERGFDHFYGFLGGARSYFEVEKIHAENQLWRNHEKLVEPGGYLTDHLANEACDFIEDNQESPFFLFLSFNAVHTPFHAKKEDMNRYPSLEGNRKKMAAMTWSMDKAIGKVSDQLKKLGLDENTLIIFANDNGGTSYFGSDNTPFSGCKATYLEGGIRIPFIMKWGNHIKKGTSFDYPVSTLDIVPTAIEMADGNANDFKILDGVDILPYISGENNNKPHETLYWNGDGPFCALRHNDWKLITMPDRLPELYDLSKDPSEKVNQAQEESEITKELLRKLFAWRNENGNARWQLQKKYEAKVVEYFDSYRK